MQMFGRKKRRRNRFRSCVAIAALESLENRSLLSAAPVVLVTQTDSSIPFHGERLPEFTWTRPDGAVSFDVRMNQNSVEVLMETELATASFRVPGSLGEGEYTAEVRAVFEDGSTTDWSVPKIVEVDRTPVVTIQGRASTTETHMTWTEHPAAVSYEVWINQSTPREQTLAFRAPRVEGNSLTVNNLQRFVTHVVWVRANLSDGSRSAWSEPVYFRPRQFSEPVRLTRGLGLETFRWPTIEWQGADSGSCEIFVNAVGSTEPVWEYQADCFLGSKIVGDPDRLNPRIVRTIPAGDYEVWIRSSDSGTWSSRGSTLRFRPGQNRTDFLKAAPRVLPVNTATNTLPELAWMLSENVERYELYVSTNNSIDAVIHETDLRTNTFTPTEELDRGLYRVWTRTHFNDGTRSPWSDVYRFEIYADQVPLTHGPGRQSTRTPTLAWHDPGDVSRFELYVSDSSSGDVVFHRSDLTESYYTFDEPLEQAESYSVWLRAHYNDGAKSVWGRASDLSIAGNAKIGFAAQQPDLTVSGSTISWLGTDHAESYELWVNQYDSDGGLIRTAVIREKSLTATEFAHNLDSGSYRVWLQAIDSQGTRSRWSDAVSFHI